MIKKLSFVFLCAILLLPTLSVAQAPIFNNPIALNSGGNTIDTIPEFMKALVDGMLLIMTPLIVVFIIYGGFLFVTAQGNEAQLEKAKKTLLWCLVGALLLIGASILSLAIQNTIDQMRTPPAAPR